jgi:hypothetical protein
MPLEVFYSYSHRDEKLRLELEKHLALLKRSNLIVGWHDRRIEAGDDWREQIDEHLRSAHIILLLISADFLASDYCHDVEMKLALDRHARHEAIVIPIILRRVDWSGSRFAHLQPLPKNAKPIAAWRNRDEASRPYNIFASGAYNATAASTVFLQEKPYLAVLNCQDWKQKCSACNYLSPAHNGSGVGALASLRSIPGYPSYPLLHSGSASIGCRKCAKAVQNRGKSRRKMLVSQTLS